MPCSDDDDGLPWRAVLFRRRWWLEAVAPGGWGEVFVDTGGVTTGHLPFSIHRRFGVVALGSPPLTPWLGPWVAPVNGGEPARLSREKEVVTGLIGRLPAHGYFNQTFDPSITNWLPFHWAGFRQTTRYTYRLDPQADEERILSTMDQRTRSVVRRARKVVEVCEETSDAAVIDLLTLTFRRQGMTLPWSEAVVARALAAARAHAAGRALVAVDEAGRRHAAAVFVWDGSTVYYLLGGTDPALRSSGAMSLLVFNGIRDAGAHGAIFDFEGSMLEGVEAFFRGFGARQVPYSTVSRASRTVRVALAGREVARALSGRR